MRKRYNLSFRREQQKKDRIKKLIIAVIILFVFAVLGTLIYFAWTGIDWGAIGNGSDKKEEDKPKETKQVEITINSVGEVTCYNSQLTAARTDDGYDFDNCFENIKKYVKDADLSLFDLETTLAGEPYSGYPQFNSPDELAESLKGAGFDVAVTANEHALDRDLDGIGETLDALDKTGLKAAGTQKDKRDKDYLITKVNGVKVGIVAYTEETSYSDSYRTLDGKSMTEEDAALINSYSPNVLDDDMEKVKASIDGAREDGAKIIICYFHWGDDYDSSVNDGEKEIAESLVDMGADMIFGTHPHMVQDMDTIKNDNGQKVPVFYSLGNFLSGQRYETTGYRGVEQGMIAQVKLTFDTKTGKITKIKYGYIPTWTDKYWDNELNSNVFTVLPLTDDLEENQVLETSGHLTNAEQALEDLTDMLGDPISSGNKAKNTTGSAAED